METKKYTKPENEMSNGASELKRCPTCGKFPVMKIEDMGFDKSNFIWQCEQHGHMAMSQSVEGAKTNWNLYCLLMTTKSVA